MSKKDVVDSQINGTEVDAAEDAEALAKFKESKKAAAQRFKERRAKEKADRIEHAKKLAEELKNSGLWDKISADSQAFISGLANPVAVSGTFGGQESVFHKLFGDNAAVGMSVTLMDAMNKTLKGKAQLDKDIKKWAEKGTVVSYKADADNLLNSTYTIEQLA